MAKKKKSTKPKAKKSARPARPAKRSQPESFRAKGIQAAMTAKDLQRSVAWYRDIVGFFVDEEHEREGRLVAVGLKAGSAMIFLSQDDGAKGLDRVRGEAISLSFETTQDVDALAKRIEASGGTLATQPATMPWGARAFRLKDPDGFNLVITSPS